MKTLRYHIVERRWSGNVLARDYEYTDTDGKTKVRTELMMVVFNKRYDLMLRDICDEQNKKLQLEEILDRLCGIN